LRTTLKFVRERAGLRKEMLSYAGEMGEAGRTVREKLNELRTAVKWAVRRDKNTHMEEMAADVERNFERSGSLRKAYLGIKRLAGQSRHAVADLQSVKVDDFQEHFRQLLGAGGTTIPDEIQATRAWRLAHTWLTDKSKYATPWDVSAEPPTRVEFGDVCESCRDDKGLSGEMIPTELWKHSEAARDLLWKLVVRVWEAMKVSKPGDKLSIPEDWLTASLVCLYKGKGDHGNNARGIVQGHFAHIRGGENPGASNLEAHQCMGGRETEPGTELLPAQEVVHGRCVQAVAKAGGMGEGGEIVQRDVH